MLGLIERHTKEKYEHTKRVLATHKRNICFYHPKNTYIVDIHKIALPQHLTGIQKNDMNTHKETV